MPKRMGLQEAVSLVKDGDQVYTGGWTVVRRPMGLVYELIRQGRKNLYLASNPGGPEVDLLIGAGCVRVGEINYIGHEVFGHPYCFRRALEQEDSREAGYLHDDWTVQTGALRLLAGAMGLPFIPTLSLKGSDIVNPDFDYLKDLRGNDPKVPRQKVFALKDPFWEGKEVFLIPALRPDVCLIHVQEVGEEGTVRIKGGTFLDYYAAQASKVVIVSAERIVPEESLRDQPELNAIPGFLVDVIVELPYGAHPTVVYGYYDNDPWWFKQYLETSKGEETFRQWLQEWVLDVGNHDGYLAKLGLQRLLQLRSDLHRGYNPDIKRRLDKLEVTT
ncbi:MAG: acyl CoA--acetate/3-ketoacid CoA transferase subunit alpha [Firmicutes bacterium]|nr:acyl CoA--acetate/3-ketoacid CoA transferase subunit alpha [Bacillota bacterium]